MSKIKLLSPLEAQKIAAGEVVERPYNVAKELLENAFDAGANTITVYIENGGKDLIRVIDNGCGIHADDIELAFAHHATSKITSVQDLTHLTTFGFRGEALSSIASVSTVTLTTKTIDDTVATCVMLNAGTVTQKKLVAGNTGTDCVVANLFFNIPARKKFLRAKETELRAIMHLFHALALSHPNVQCILHSDQRRIAFYPTATTTHERIVQVLAEAGEEMLVGKGEKNGVSIELYISKPQHVRYDRNAIFLFVNKRWVKNNKLSQALIRGYANVLPPQRFPSACIVITAPPEEIDVNIHPRKEEVLFLHPRIVENLIESVVNETLQTFRSHQLGFSSPPLTPTTPTNHPARNPLFDRISISPTPFDGGSLSSSEFSSILDEAFESSVPPASSEKSASAITRIPLPLQASEQLVIPTIGGAPTNTSTAEQFTILGSYNKTYILLETAEGLVLVDQHAAHERVLYEEFLLRFKDVPSCPLLFPTIVDLSASDYAALVPHLDSIRSHGVQIHDSGNGKLVVTALPVQAKHIDAQALLRECVAYIHECRDLDDTLLQTKLTHHIRAQMACKAAVKAGDTLVMPKMDALIRQLNTSANRLTCPHGRPTSWLISLNDIERKFKRKL